MRLYLIPILDSKMQMIKRIQQKEQITASPKTLMKLQKSFLLFEQIMFEIIFKSKSILKLKLNKT